jgi:hypothetical protein
VCSWSEGEENGIVDETRLRLCIVLF